MSFEELLSAIEAVLFASGEPMSAGRLCEVFSLDAETLDQLLVQLSDRLKDRKSGLMVIELDGAYQLATKPDYADYIKSAFDLRRKTPLSQAALEVLAVVAYHQPVTKAFVEQVRGVDCSGVFTTLVEKDLIEERGRLELPGRPLLYGTTKTFLRCFSLKDLGDLPPLPQKEQDPAPDLAEQLPVEAVYGAEPLQGAESGVAASDSGLHTLE